MKIKFLIYLVLFSAIFLIFKNWFSFLPLSAGDWSYKFPQTIRGFTLYPYAWDESFINGLGENEIFLLAFKIYFFASTSILFTFFHIPWIIIERLVWFLPFLIASILGSFALFKRYILNNLILALLSSLIFTINTYALMLVGGGQLGVAMGYAVLPFVALAFFNIFESINQSIFFIHKSLLAGILFSVLVLFDLRIAYVGIVFIGIYYIVFLVQEGFIKTFKKSIILFAGVPAIITIMLHFSWLFPFAYVGQNPLNKLGEAYTGTSMVSFLSFAKFEDAISLLHPNWPENIFGKVGFLKPEFLLLPILAFSSLYFISKTKDQRAKSYVLFFALLGLVGAFLAKGANNPFGGIYLWMFKHLPGFIMFRDPTKWYTLIAISYSMLIPFSVWKIYDALSTKYKVQGSKVQLKIQKFIPSLFLLVIVFYLFYLIRPALLGELTGTFKPTTIPSDYVKLEQFLSSKNHFSRTLWIPATQRFGFYSSNHPKVTSQDFFKTLDISKINRKVADSQVLLENSSIKYVIVPYDSQGEIFLKDRKYNKEIFQKAINDVKKISYLKQVSGFEKIAVFEVPNPKDHFWSPSKTLFLSYQYVSPVEYKLDVKNAHKEDIIVFAESFDSKWVAYDGNLSISSNRFNGLFNSFKLPKDGSYSLKVYYYPQKYVEIGSVVSLVTFIIVIFFLILSFKRSKNK